MAKDKSISASCEDNPLVESVHKEIRRLQKALATLSCLKVALAEEMWNEIDCEDVAAVVCKLLGKTIRNLDSAASKK